MADVIGRGDYSKSLKNAFGLTGRTALLLGSEIVPVAIVGDLDGHPYGWKRPYAFVGSSGPTVGQYSFVGIGNPVNSRVIKVLRRSTLYGATGAQIFVMLNVTSYSGSAPVGGSRGWSLVQPVNGAAGRSSDEVLIGSQVGVPLAADMSVIINIAANTTHVCEYEATLYPGSWALWFNNQVNSLIGASVQWDEYDL